MNLIKQLLSNLGINLKKNEDKTSSKTSPAKAEVKNPYLQQGRREWDDRYLVMSTVIKHWRYAFFAATGLALVLAIVIGRMATESRITPVVVETCRGAPTGVTPVTGTLANQDVLGQYLVNQFIIDARGVVADPDTEKRLITRVYDYLAGDALDYLNAYYPTNNPIEIAANKLVSVHILNTTKVGDGAWEVTWDETVTSRTGSGASVSRWIANIKLTQGQINPDTQNINPFGLYVTELSWSKIH